MQSIAATTTRRGLTVHAELDTGEYPTGIKIPDNKLRATQAVATRYDKW